jgi:KDO2-lipid IV(A) lauroyltransferase
MKGKIAYILLKITWKLLSLIPLKIMYFLSDLWFYPFYYILRYRRKIVRKNLTESFPEKSLDEIIHIEKRFYHFFTDVIFETCKMASFSEKNIKKHIKFMNVEAIDALLQQEISVSLFVGHYGNWEWNSSMTLHLTTGIVPGQIYHKLHNPAVNRLMLWNRSRMGANCVEMKDTLRWINEQIQNHFVSITGYIADQSPKRHNQQHFVDFLHHHTPALTGAEKITKKYGFAAFYLDVKRVKRGYYEVDCVQLHEDPQSLPNFQLTDIYYAHLEKSIQNQPELYLWTHRRFKYATTKQSE